MKRIKKSKIACLFLSAFLFALPACGEYKGVNDNDTPVVPDTPIDGDYENADGYFSVRLVWDGYLYTDTAGMQAQWSNGTSLFRANFVNGVAKIPDLDGDYAVTIYGLSDKYMYNPNGNIATNFDKDIDVEVFERNRPTLGDGSSQYYDASTYKGAYKIGNAGVYTATIDSPSDVVFYHFTPTRAGSFVVETIMDTTENMVNPIFDMYIGTFAFNQYDYTLDSGGASSTYTRNVKYVMNLDAKKVGNNLIFGVKATQKYGSYPTAVNFVIKYVGAYSDPDAEANRQYISADPVMLAKHGQITQDKIVGNINNPQYVQIDLNQAGTVKLQTDEIGTGVYDPETGEEIMRDFVRYFEEDDVYRVYNQKTGEYDITLFAQITKRNRFFFDNRGQEISFSNVQSVGNSALRVSDGTEDYTQFIADLEARVDNSVGVYPVTKALKEFLQKFSVRERYFADGNGWAETTAAAPVSQKGLGYQLFSSEDDQWLFGCVYYI